ncbi:MAG: D-alanyl-D-alanine carboxypeptidase/D-alanyl-D-alanine endopeptidase [Actinomycetota bacterium]
MPNSAPRSAPNPQSKPVPLVDKVSTSSAQLPQESEDPLEHPSSSEQLTLLDEPEPQPELEVNSEPKSTSEPEPELEVKAEPQPELPLELEDEPELDSEPGFDSRAEWNRWRACGTSLERSTDTEQTAWFAAPSALSKTLPNHPEQPATPFTVLPQELPDRATWPTPLWSNIRRDPGPDPALDPAPDPDLDSNLDLDPPQVRPANPSPNTDSWSPIWADLVSATRAQPSSGLDVDRLGEDQKSLKAPVQEKHRWPESASLLAADSPAAVAPLSTPKVEPPKLRPPQRIIDQRRRVVRRRRLVAVCALLAVISYAAADLGDLVPGYVTTRSSAQVKKSAGPLFSALPGPSAAAIQPVTTTAPRPDAEALANVLDPILNRSAVGAAVSATVVDPLTGAVLYSRDADEERIPASTVKLLTGAAALTSVGPTTRLTTRVVQGKAANEIVLVGGGDILLGEDSGDDAAVAGYAGLSDLADQVSAELMQQGVRQVTLSYDDNLFAGPMLNPRWKSVDVSTGNVGRVTSLGLVTDRAVPGNPGPSNPAESTTKAFADALKRSGITVTGSLKSTQAQANAREWGRVQSAPLERIVGFSLTESDNTLTDVLARLVAIDQGVSATSEAAANVVIGEIQSLGVDVTGVQLTDSSGLAVGNSVPVRVLADVLTLAATDRPELRSLITDVAVAGSTGTLAKRFTGSSHAAAVGVVRAKTGTLSQVAGLAGTTVADGRLLVFAVVANSVSAGGRDSARNVLDDFAAALTACGCQSM